MNTATNSPTLQHEAAPRTRGRTAPTGEVQETPTSTRSQYLIDLDTLDRIERQNGEQDPCFFTAMGEISAVRRGDA